VEIDGWTASRFVCHPLGQLRDGEVRAIDGEGVPIREILADRMLQQPLGHCFMTRALLLGQGLHVARENPLRVGCLGDGGGRAEQGER
jgi:hypothetical protein